MTDTSAPSLTSALINQVLSIKPLWAVAKGRVRAMMVKRAAAIGVSWDGRVAELRSRSDGGHSGTADLSPQWQVDLEAIQNPTLQYPDYYTTSFHAYDEGNLGWLPAMEVEVAAKAVHAKLWPGAGANGDAQLRQSYHNALMPQLPQSPQAIVDLGCGVGMSTEALQALYPQAQVTGLTHGPGLHGSNTALRDSLELPFRIRDLYTQCQYASANFTMEPTDCEVL